MNQEEDSGIGIPEWVVTFGDMMSLLLTFFIMLVSMSEIKEEERYQAMVESIRRQFGHDASMMSIMPGASTPRNSHFDKLATMGRARRANTMNGGDKVKAPVGDHPRVQSIRPGQLATPATVIFFDTDQAQLTDEDQRQLIVAAQHVGGKPQKIELRGHTSRKPVPGESKHRDNWDLAYDRCRVVMEQLVQLGIDARRFRVNIAAENEPVYIGIDPAEQIKNSRVEVVMLNELVEEFEGDDAARQKRYIDK